MAERGGDLAGRVSAAERTRLAHLNQLAHEVSRVVRHTLECVGRLLSSPTDTTAEPSGLLVSSLRRLSDCLERVFDSFADTTTAQHDRHLNCAERQQQRSLSEGLLRRMKELILQGAGIIQAAQQQPVAEAEALERGFKGVVQRFVVDLREIIRLQHVIVEPADDQQHGRPFADGNQSGPSALPSRTTTDVAADVRSVTSSVSYGALPAGRPPVPSHQPGSGPAEKNVWLRAGTPTDGETGEPRKTHLTHALAARRLMSLGRRASHEAGLAGGSTSTSTSADAGDGGDEGAGSPVTVHPYRRSRIVYGFKVKEGAMKLKVELQTEETEEGEGETEGRPWGEGGDEVPQPREAGHRWSGGGGGTKEELSDEQFVSMMLNFFGEMERRKAALANTPPAARRNPHPPADATTTPPAAAQQVPEGDRWPAAELQASTPSDEREPNEEGKARKIPHSPPPAQKQHEGDGEEGSGTSPTRQQLKKKVAAAENEGGGSRQGAKAKEGRWYKCILS